MASQQSGTLQTRGSAQMSYPDNLQGSKLTYGSGTTIDVWIQTSIDGGTNCTDIANFHWTTTGGRQLFNLPQ